MWIVPQGDKVSKERIDHALTIFDVLRLMVKELPQAVINGSKVTWNHTWEEIEENGRVMLTGHTYSFQEQFPQPRPLKPQIDDPIISRRKQ